MTRTPDPRAARPRSFRRWLAGILLGSLFLPVTAPAQIPALIEGEGKAAAPVVAESPEQLRERLTRQLREARSQRDQFGDQPGQDALSGFGASELAAARASLGRRVLALESQLRVLDEQKTARAALQDAEKATQDWKGFADPPPYSLLLVDDLSESADSIRTKLAALSAQRVIAGREAERMLEQARRSQAALRQARETADAAGTAATPQQQARVALAGWTADADAAEAAVIQRGLELVDQQAAVEREHLKLAERKLETASRDARFSAEDLAQVRKREGERQARIRAARTKVADEAERRGRDLAAAAAALSSLEANPTTPADDLSVARARVRAAQAGIDASRFEVDMLDSLAAVAGVGVELYVLRQQALGSSDAEQRRNAVEKLREARARLAPWREYAQSQLDLLRASVSESSLRAESRNEPPPVLAYEQEVGEQLRRRLTAAQRLFEAAGRADRTVTRWLVEIDQAQSGRPLVERLADAWAATRDSARSIWNFELFAVEDTVQVGGQKITTSQGVTVGKSVGALLLFALGLWRASHLARRF